MKLQASFTEVTRTLDIAALERPDRESVQEHCNPVIVFETLVLREALLPQLRREVELAGKVRRAAERSKRASSQERCRFVASFEKRGVPTHPLRCIAESPELLQRDEQLEAEHDLVPLERPAEGRAEICNIEDDDRRFLLAGNIGVQRRTQRQVAVVLRVARTELIRLVRFREVPGGEFR